MDTFLENGFEGTAMEAIARAAGITKRTLYARYPDKNALFADTLVWALTKYHSSELPPEVGEWDLAKGLMEVARSTLARARDPDVARLHRMAIMQAARIPDFSTKAYSTTWSPRVKAVANLLRTHKKAGDVAVDDVDMAAEHFVAMVGQSTLWLAALGQARPRELEERYTKHAVELFLRAIRPQRPPQGRPRPAVVPAARASGPSKRRRQSG
jgi:AcrR family transcriptional regulator